MKQAHALYPNVFVNDVLKDAPGGVHVVLIGPHPNRHNLIAI